MEVIGKMPYVKATKLTEEKALLMSELHEAVEEMKLIRSGKKNARNAEDFLKELSCKDGFCKDTISQTTSCN